ncbi:XdhC family protein [Nitriliruptor alkaliphilus]|uniref:XdhC family protein n=1 Tax=Nitriliruptor alkaliphilus TaxID=427918 RepID=UPI0006987E4C|nr:XdhC/CoxI family protein [Nitriliruptor alkaliphilus]
MREELGTLRSWQRDGVRFALATVVATSQSAPRPAGAVLAVHPDGEVLGSVSGGCVEGAVVEVATEVLETGVPQRVRYGISDDEAFAVGLTCGGTIEVFVRTVAPGDLDLDALALDLEADAPVAVAVVVDGERAGATVAIRPEGVTGSTGDEGLDHAVVADARGMLQQGATGLRHYGPHGERRIDDVGVFVAAFAPRPRMLVFGAIDFAGAVASIGRFLGYHVTVCDARARFATQARFPDADEVVVAWPHRYLSETDIDARTVICVLTHDPKFDVPVLEGALRTDAAYVGVMGSRRTHEDRLARLREAGVSETQLERLRSPIGLDLGARTPQETAVSIAAEILLERHGGSGARLTDTVGPIHREREPV